MACKNKKITKRCDINSKNSLSVKKTMLPRFKWPVWKKLWIQRVQPRMAVMVYVDGKSFNSNNSGNFVLIHRIRQHIIKIFATNLYHPSHFLVAPFDFTAFFTLAILNRAAELFLQLNCFYVSLPFSHYCNAYSCLCCIYLQ